LLVLLLLMMLAEPRVRTCSIASCRASTAWLTAAASNACGAISAHLLNCILQGLNGLVHNVALFILCKLRQDLYLGLLLLLAPRAFELLQGSLK
jgi:hypothetical protein